MNKEFKKAKWIWTRKNYSVDEYAEFALDVQFRKDDKIILKLASDSNYYITINEVTRFFGQYADYIDYKVFDTLDLSSVLSIGNNKIIIHVWYYGVSTQNYQIDKPGLIFELSKNGNPILWSNKKTLSRLNVNYTNGRKKYISSQLGLSYKYDLNVNNTLDFTESVIIKKSHNLNPRLNKKLLLLDAVPSKLINKEGSYLYDMESETVGFLDFDIDSDKEQEIIIAYGEWVNDENHVRRFMNNDDFSVTINLKKGNNKYTNYFRRLAGRYLEVFSKNPIKINRLSLMPTVYDVKPVNIKFNSELRNRIYQTSLKTLHCCMHEHFEDCPWREQALYNMDSRNESLATYFGFNDFEFVRSNLTLMSHGLSKHGILSICFPTEKDIPIPSFSLIYPIQIFEYIQYSNDYSILDEVLPTVDKMMNLFISRIEDNGLIADFPYPFWNFYEWSDGSNNGDQISRTKDDKFVKQYDLILNALMYLSMTHYKKLLAFKNRNIVFDDKNLLKAIKKNFFNQEKGLYFASTIDQNLYTSLGNSLVVLCGLGGEEIIDNIVNNKEVVPITLSMNTFLYDAMLMVNKEKYMSYVLEDIDKKYKRMLDAGATTFWETEEGKESLAHTGSLCHGWSSMPIYYYQLLNGKDYYDGKL